MEMNGARGFCPGIYLTKHAVVLAIAKPYPIAVYTAGEKE